MLKGYSMKRLGISALILVGMLSGANAATPQQRRGTAAGNNATAQSNTTSARSAVSARSAARTPAAGTSNASAARAATSGRTTVARGTQPSASTTTAARSATVSARAGAMQKVIGTGTKVATATKNIVVSEECQQKYDGCMDSFCMIDNASGGRCMCSDRNKELDAILAEIEKLDQQSYQMATVGVERIEMGNDADQAIANANAVAQSFINTQNNEKKTTTRRKLDLSLWNTQIDFDDDEDAFASGDIDSIDGKEGDALHRAASEICVAMIPECSAEKSMLQMTYAQRIKSDCTAYENHLKQQKSSSQQKLYAAEKALRDAALDQLRTANKYDLGQCTVEFKKCMATTGGCGDDFKGCVGIAAAENAKNNVGSSSSMKMYEIKGSATKISIAASSYDALESKKPLCMSITNSCVAVKDQVWDTFLREVAPQIKTAELLAESDLRTSCISNISQCFQKACKDTMDPNDPDGSYDMCLSRPETVRSLCKVQIDPCISAEPLILDFVYARLAAMRVDSCTNEVKECLQSDDRCGSDYTQCIGLDTDSIIRMCPYDKLVGCQKVYGETDIRGEAVYDELATMVQGIMLNIDNSFMTECQNAANEAMIKVCGSTEDCNGLAIDDGIGTRSLEYKICQYDANQSSPNYNDAACYASPDTVTESVLRNNIPIAGVLSGLIFWNSIDFDDDGNLTSMEDYISKTGLTMTETQQTKMRTELESLRTNVQSAIQTIEADPTVKFCMTGREVQGMKINNTRSKIGERSTEAARFPELTKQIRQTIAIAALQAAKSNYYKEYDELNNKMVNDFQVIGKRIIELSANDSKDAQREAGRVACNNLAYFYNLAKAESPNINGSTADTSSASSGIIQDAYVMPYTGSDNALKSTEQKMSEINGKRLKAESAISNLALIQKTTTTYNWDTMSCQRCLTVQTCKKVKNPLFRSKFCKAWTDAKTECTTIQF